MRNNRWFTSGAAGLALAGLAMMVTASVARSQVDADVRASIYPDADAVAVGGGVLAPMGSQGDWYFNPNIDLALGDRRNLVMVSGDFHYDFTNEGNATFWVGGGPAVMVVDRKVGDSSTDLGVNALTGVGARRGQVRPFAQLRGTVADNSQVTIAGGIRF